MRSLYKRLYEKNYQFYTRRPNAVLLLKVANVLLSAVFFLLYGIVFLQIAEKLPEKELAYERLTAYIFAPAFCLFLVSVLRGAIARPRPYSTQGANVTPLLQKQNVDKSFPSRHTASAFVICVSVLSITPVGYVFLPFAIALGYVRFALGLHYISDLLGGAGIGVLCGLLCFI